MVVVVVVTVVTTASVSVLVVAVVVSYTVTVDVLEQVSRFLNSLISILTTHIGQGVIVAVMKEAQSAEALEW